MKGKNIIKIEKNILEDTSPWFIKFYKGKPIVTISDLYILVGEKVELGELIGNKNIINYMDWNGIGRGNQREEFERINRVRYEDETLIYLHIIGFLKVLKIFIDKNKITLHKAESILNSLDNNVGIKYIG